MQQNVKVIMWCGAQNKTDNVNGAAHIVKIDVAQHKTLTLLG